MEVRRLALTGFRSYDSLEIAFPPGPQVLFGPNAAGKTNLLEALVVLGLGRSHRTTADAELVAWGAPFARLEADVIGSRDRSAARLEVVIARAAPGGGRKRVRINGVARRASALSDTLRLVVFAPEEMLLVVGSPMLRRATLDSLAAMRSPAYGRALATYSRALQQRNSLLRAIREGLGHPDELRYWDRIVVDEGGVIVAERHALLGALAAPLVAAHAEIAPGEGRLTVEYLTNAPAEPGETAAAALRRRLSETAEKEVWNGTTLVGPHRDDLAFRLDGRELTTFASRGQQRTAILALKLAELELLRARDGTPPLLLLDDVFSELDQKRRAHLVRRIGELPQAFVTTTTLDDLDPALVAASTTWRVSAGTLEPHHSPETRTLPRERPG
ncbi:MAG: DNA replication and repair protein RecF [Chloroflexota bacterium]|nr:DNA replication and repair protein RecF [Chloroflexota bacterium]